jgi:DNA topoisomerase-2
MASTSAKPIEERYRKHELRDHVYHLPDTYVGSAEKTPIETYVFDDATQRMVKRELTYVPALLKIFDEVVVNAIDQCMRLKAANAAADAKQVKNIWITVNKDTGRLTVMNDGDGIDIEKHPEFKVWIPELIFGELLTSSNYDQNEEKVWGGKNGIGLKSTNIFSKELIAETIDHRRKKIYTQRFFNNMKERNPAAVKAYSKVPYTKIDFLPDYQRFGMSGMTEDMYELFKKRAYDACATTPSTVTVYFNGDKLEFKTLEKYVDLYLGDKSAWPRAYEASADGRWEVSATYSEHGQFDQVSFVNGINTFRGGKHVEYVTNQITKSIAEMMAKKKATATQQHVKANLMVFVKSLIVNPAFDSQSKETLTTPVAKFGSKFELSDKFMTSVYKTGLAEKASSLTAFHDTKKAAKTDGKKTSRVIVPKLDDANHAGTKHSNECTLILTEGLSAKTMAIAGLTVVGRDKWGVFPLKGKILNVKDALTSRINDNEEISNLKKILGLQVGKTYKDTSELRYGHVMMLCDQDTDGSHIKGLLFNMFQSLWPSLYKIPGFTISLLTPIVTVSNKDESRDFYNMTDFENWMKTNPRKGWTIKYKKGLGTSTESEAKKYFKEMKVVTYTHNEESDEAMDLAFNKKRADDRKAWLMQYDREVVLDYAKKEVPYNEFVHKELIHFSNDDLERSINHICDGLKESTRKILYGCLKRRLFNGDMKVAQLAAYVAETSAYHHGEVSLQQAITGMAQIYVGTNNINLLQPNGQFGTRIHGGSDAASARYIYTVMTKLAQTIYKEEDSPILEYNDDDGTPVEPTYYVPIVPMVLVNGALGIGTGFSTNVPQHNPSDIVKSCEALIAAIDKELKHIDTEDQMFQACSIIDNTDLPQLVPWYLGFTGTITSAPKEGSFVSKGVYRWNDDTTVEITELPIGTWTDDYKEMLQGMIAGNHASLKDFESHYTARSVRFILKLYPGARAKLESNFENEFKLTSTKNLSLNNIHLYGEDGAIKRFKDTNEVLREWAYTRLEKYKARKEHQLDTMQKSYLLISAKVRFIQDIIDEKLKIMNKKIKEVEAQLHASKYPTMHEPLKDSASVGSATNEGGEVAQEGGYGYLTRMPINQLTFEKKQALEKEAHDIHMKIEQLKATAIHHLWRQELREFSHAWEAHRSAMEDSYKADRENRVVLTAGKGKRGAK